MSINITFDFINLTPSTIKTNFLNSFFLHTVNGCNFLKVVGIHRLFNCYQHLQIRLGFLKNPIISFESNIPL